MMIAAAKVALVLAALFFSGVGGVEAGKPDRDQDIGLFAFCGTLAIVLGLIGAFI